MEVAHTILARFVFCQQVRIAMQYCVKDVSSMRLIGDGKGIALLGGLLNFKYRHGVSLKCMKQVEQKGEMKER